MSAMDATLDPKPENQDNTKRASVPMRVYVSSIGGLVSVYVGVHGHASGLRLDREQVAELHEALGFWLDDDQ